MITWTNPADIVYGTALSGTQLNATASTAGTLTYTPGSGTVLTAGNGQALSVSFAPTDSANYNAAAKNVTINVSKATPTVSWSNPPDITYGTALGSSQLNATASVPGSFEYLPAAGTVLNAGAAQALAVTFKPTDAANYNTGTKSVALNVLKAEQTITFAALVNKTYGDPDFTVSATATSGLAVAFTASGSSTIAGNSVHLTGSRAGNDHCFSGGEQQLQRGCRGRPLFHGSNRRHEHFGNVIGQPKHLRAKCDFHRHGNIGGWNADRNGSIRHRRV